MGILSALFGSQSEHGEQHDGRVVVEDEESGTFWSRSGKMSEEVEEALNSDGYTIVEDNRSLWNRLFG